MSDSTGPDPRRKVPPRYWVWLGVILLLMLWPAVFFGIAPQIATHLRPGLCVLGIGDVCFMSGATFVGLWTTLTFTAALSYLPGLAIGAIALIVWYLKVLRYLPDDDRY